MGIFLNPSNESFKEVANSNMYVDKTGLLTYTNSVLESMQKYICVSRPRRFGKSITARMLAAYYGKDEDSLQIFNKLEIADSQDFMKHLNQYDVIHFDLNTFIRYGKEENGIQVVSRIQREINKELREKFPDCMQDNEEDLPKTLALINLKYGTKFIFIIDEWDALFREYKNDMVAQESYIRLLRGLFKDEPSSRFIRLAYLTGILPIKKYGKQSALNNFYEFTMTNSSPIEQYVGFTNQEVFNLCEKYHSDYDKMKLWYDGYHLSDDVHIYNPKSVSEALMRKKFDNYWTQTETYESLKEYITSNFDGLKDAIIELIAGRSCTVDIATFQNDMVSMRSRDDILTLLIHLGYLAYDSSEEKTYIPNEEIRKEFARTIKNTQWTHVAEALANSKQLLDATLEMDSDYVEQALEKIHSDATSILQYHNENSLSCAISLAYYAAKDYYTMFRELPQGKGFADIVFIPNRGVNMPALVVELKWDKNAETAMKQIENKRYTQNLSNFSGKILLVGINYDKKEKKHQCEIREIEK